MALTKTPIELSSTPGIVDNSNATAITMSGAGEVTMPTQPSFSAVPASVQNNFAIDDLVTVAFGTEVFDVGSNFASSTFTAPVTGKYSLNVGVRLQVLDSAAASYQIRITTSNRAYLWYIDPDFGQDASLWTLGGSVLADMDASDTAIVQVAQLGGTQQTDIGQVSFFNGYLAC